MQVNHSKSLLVKNFINTLILLQGHLRLYGSANTIIELTGERLMGFFNLLLGEDADLTVYVGRHSIIYEGQFVERSNRFFEQFSSRLFHHGIAAITFSKGLTAEQIQVFLKVVSRSPSSSWDEGGAANALRLRNVSHIFVREMNELDFDIVEDLEEVTPNPPVSPLWERFALSIVHGLHANEIVSDELAGSPGELAEAVNNLLAGVAGSKDELLARDLSRFLVSLKHENIRIYREATLKLLAEFVDSINPVVRDLFMRNIFNLNIDADLFEGLLRGVSAQSLMDALRNASGESGYVPPMVLQMLGRLAEERGFAAPENITSKSENDDWSERVAELFRADDFDKYVPKEYQVALLSIIKSGELPAAVSENLGLLKKTLESQAVDKHVGEILLLMLKGSITGLDLVLIKKTLLDTIDGCLLSHNYLKVSEILSICHSDHLWGAMAQDIEGHLSSEHFSKTLLKDLGVLDRESVEECVALIRSIGEPFIPALLDHLSEETNRSLRRLYLNLLTEMGMKCVSAAVSRLTDSRWHVVRNMIYLLRELGNPVVLQYIRPLIRHSHPKVSQEALRTCLGLKDKYAVRFLLAFLDGENEGELLQAVSNAAVCDDPVVFKKLVTMLKSSSMLNFRLALKKAIVRSLVAVAPKKALAVFTDILNAHNFFHRNQHEKLRVEIIGLLDKIPGDEGKRLLVEQAKNGSGAVSLAAQSVLAKVSGGGL